MALILVVDDESRIILFAKTWLEKDGHTVLTAQDGVAAADIIIENNGELDLVVSDLNMPKLDGFGLYLWIGTEFPLLAPKFLFHTSSMGELDKYEQTADVRKMDKPGPPGEFMRVVNEMLPKKAAAVLEVQPAIS